MKCLFHAIRSLRSTYTTQYLDKVWAEIKRFKCVRLDYLEFGKNRPVLKHGHQIRFFYWHTNSIMLTTCDISLLSKHVSLTVFSIWCDVVPLETTRSGSQTDADARAEPLRASSTITSPGAAPLWQAKPQIIVVRKHTLFAFFLFHLEFGFDVILHATLMFYSINDEMIQIYPKKSATMAVRDVWLLGAPRCHDIGVVLRVLGVSKEHVCDFILEGKLMACFVLHYADNVSLVMLVM
jgi:hypothetical protein